MPLWCNDEGDMSMSRYITCDACSKPADAVFLTAQTEGLACCLDCCDTLGVVLPRSLRYYSASTYDYRVEAERRQAEAKAVTYARLTKAGFIRRGRENV